MEYALENAIAEGYGTNDWPVSHINLSASQAHQLIALNPPKIIDVRESSEYSMGHIPGAIASPWNSKIFQGEHADIMPNSGSILLACQSGNRSGEAADYLHQEYLRWGVWDDQLDDFRWRYKDLTVYNLTGGMNAWSTANFEVSTDPYNPPETTPDVISDSTPDLTPGSNRGNTPVLLLLLKN